uniref:Iron-sulfur cluster assembly protein n=1 Tax=Eucampia antarctica TaxID=49252 RepID=A0A7S2VZX5_9STRA|mmetsp:Transcript_1350/g.1291  ORF Transcript_1350/g.1291 Transcript_1350/m.1291 type:complete len:174 (+) Transcript_1350:83-604(+)|eukprot:CAMPEP_0197824988 /NCGR_PEP_ID=MMETSP1437-20131217/2148_1 /TAXON_ID=49252 ORGANISM="Eucampia antarctica, Strain CCMP1452" /NCGR_SAMPLE_ID=MMETSP1437 /ASSEMBLY_ACC=CAM_ASM_001096 /LENGTH=173 /DNA_ID=CAMNT_0043424813 /DNA_START=52 /DNA_END=573 /DNA_ORIENTATION=-
MFSSVGSKRILTASAATLNKISSRNIIPASVINGFNNTTKRSYHDTIVEHYENPRNVGSLDKDDSHVGTGLVGAPACGDVMKLQIQVDDDGNIVDSKFKTFGCGSAIASSSVATEWVKGRSVDEVLGIKNADIAAHLKLPPVKLHCSMLAEDAIRAAVRDWKSKQEAKKVQKE